MVTTETYPTRQCRCNVLFMWKVNFEKKSGSSIEKFPSLVLARNTIMSQHPIVQFPLYYLSSGRLRGVKNKRKLQTVSSKSGRGRLQEVPNVVIWLGNFLKTGRWGEVVAYEWSSQPEVRLYIHNLTKPFAVTSVRIPQLNRHQMITKRGSFLVFPTLHWLVDKVGSTWTLLCLVALCYFGAGFSVNFTGVCCLQFVGSPAERQGDEKLVYRLIQLFSSTEISSKRRKIYACWRKTRAFYV